MSPVLPSESPAESMRRAARYHAALALVVASVSLAFAGAATAEDAGPESDPRAVELADRCLAAMGGAEAWDATRFLRFDFFGFRLHHWDRYTGRHRLEGKTRDGHAYVVLHDVETREGRAWLDGAELSGDAAKEWLQRGYEAWINDTYWLLMPYKMRDPGVRLAYDGEETVDGRLVDKVVLTFGNVGLTPGDRYWAYLDRESGLMTRWAYHLEDMKPEDPPTHWRWEGWERHGRILLSPTRVNPDPEKGATRSLGRIAVFDELPDSVFTSPEPVVE